jgi:hypothetical protein
MAGASVVAGKSVDAVFDTSGVLGTGFTSLFVLYVLSDTFVCPFRYNSNSSSRCSGRCIGGIGMSDDPVLNTDGANFTSLFVSFTAPCLMVAAAAGAAANAVAGASVVAEVSPDGADLGTGGIGGINSSSFLVSFVFLDMKIAAATRAAADAVQVHW